MGVREIGARAEAAASARNHNHPHPAVRRGSLDRPREAIADSSRKGIQALGPVQGDDRDAAVHLVNEVLIVVHDASSRWIATTIGSRASKALPYGSPLKEHAYVDRVAANWLHSLQIESGRTVWPK